MSQEHTQSEKPFYGVKFAIFTYVMGTMGQVKKEVILFTGTSLIRLKTFKKTKNFSKNSSQKKLINAISLTNRLTGTHMKQKTVLWGQICDIHLHCEYSV